MMMAMAITAPPAEPSITSTAAVPTRSAEAYWMPRAMAVAPLGSPIRGSTLRYARLASR